MNRLIALLLVISSCLYGSESVQIFHTQDRTELKNELQQSILSAQKSILIFTFTLSDASTIRLLNQKAEEGVIVAVVIDKEHRGPITAQGSPKIQILTRTSGEGRVHHKALVIDDEIVWLGSANITESAFIGQENMMVRLVSKKLGAFLHHEKMVFENMASRVAQGPVVDEISGQKVTFGLLPHDGFPQKKVEAAINRNAKECLLNEIRQAKESLLIAMMVWTDTDLAEAVKEVWRRGVTVDVVTADLGGVVGDLQRAGIKVSVNPKFRLMHNKFMYVDRIKLVVGSANWSKSSFTRNDESFLVLDALTHEQQLLMESYWDYLKN